MAKYPSLVFHFSVEWGGKSVSFTEVSGLTQEAQVVEYRTGDSNDYNGVKMPGLRKFNNITMKRGISSGDNDFFKWLNTIRLNDVERRTITIKLLNEKHAPVMTWVAQNAFPVKVEGPGLKASGNEVAIESIEIAHEGLTLDA